jgi:cell division protein FtsQ
MDEAKARRVRYFRLRRVLAGVAGLALVAALIAAYISPLFRVQNVEIAGAAQTDPAVIVEMADLEGQSMLHLDLSGVHERIAFLPAVKAVRVQRQWPHTVRIYVTERQPWGLWQVGGRNYVIDAEGVVLDDPPVAEGAPLIRDTGNAVRLVPGDRVDADAVALTQALLHAVPEALALNVAVFEYNSSHGLTVVTDAGYRVVIGDSQNLQYKLSVWKAIEAEFGREAMAGHLLDLRFRNKPSFQ